MYNKNFLLLVGSGVLFETLIHHNIPRLVSIAHKIMRSLSVPEKERSLAIMGTQMHDLGKIWIPESILKEGNPLTPEENDLIKLHPEKGAEIAIELDFPEIIVAMILNHHENWDGSGYPQGLKGSEIPLLARVLRLADFFDAIQSPRPYHQPLNSEEAYSKIMAGSGTLFDPEIVSVLSKILAIH